MMKPSPTAPFVVAQTEILFQILIVALDAPALVGDANQRVERRVWRQSRKPIIERLRITFGAFDQQPFLIAQCGPPVIAV
ncbi:hypothetical protein WK62_23580 [Burkholderia ubonensis]|nr:hypothetical protein WK62_23580 [Burkholderia ubonensis]